MVFLGALCYSGHIKCIVFPRSLSCLAWVSRFPSAGPFSGDCSPIFPDLECTLF